MDNLSFVRDREIGLSFAKCLAAPFAKDRVGKTGEAVARIGDVALDIEISVDDLAAALAAFDTHQWPPVKRGSATHTAAQNTTRDKAAAMSCNQLRMGALLSRWTNREEVDCVRGKTIGGE